jgi:hypothetical protein
MGRSGERTKQSKGAISQLASLWPYELQDGGEVLRILRQAALNCRNVNPQESRRLSRLGNAMSLDGGLPRRDRLRKWHKLLAGEGAR